MNSAHLLWQTYKTAIWADCEQGFQYVKDSGPLIAGIGLFAIPFAYIIDITYANPSFDTAIPRSVALVACLGLAFTKMSDHRYDKYYIVYWFFTLATMISVWGGMLVFNAATTPHGESQDLIFWLLQYIVALFLYSQLCTTPQLGITAWAFGTLCIYGILWTFEDPNWIEVNKVMTYMLPVYAGGIWIGAIYNHNRTIARNESLSSLHAIASNIAHELRTPISGIATRAVAIEAFADSLPIEHRKTNPETPKNFEDMHASTKNALQAIEEEASRASALIDTILIQTKGAPISKEPEETFRVSEIVGETLDTFPYDRAIYVKNVVFECKHDFVVKGPRRRIVHMLYGLLNSSRDLLNRPDMKISVIADSRDSGNYLLITPLDRTERELQSAIRRVGTHSELVSDFCSRTLSDLGGELVIGANNGSIRVDFPTIEVSQD